MTFLMYCRSVETREWYITHFGLTLQQDKSFSDDQTLYVCKTQYENSTAKLDHICQGPDTEPPYYLDSIIR